jgi:hypothetical protein
MPSETPASKVYTAQLAFHLAPVAMEIFATPVAGAPGLRVFAPSEPLPGNPFKTGKPGAVSEQRRLARAILADALGAPPAADSAPSASDAVVTQFATEVVAPALDRFRAERMFKGLLIEPGAVQPYVDRAREPSVGRRHGAALSGACPLAGDGIRHRRDRPSGVALDARYCPAGPSGSTTFNEHMREDR